MVITDHVQEIIHCDC